MQLFWTCKTDAWFGSQNQATGLKNKNRRLMPRQTTPKKAKMLFSKKKAKKLAKVHRPCWHPAAWPAPHRSTLIR